MAITLDGNSSLSLTQTAGSTVFASQNLVASEHVTATMNITSSAGDITATTGNITAGGNISTGGSIVSTGVGADVDLVLDPKGTGVVSVNGGITTADGAINAGNATISTTGIVSAVDVNSTNVTTTGLLRVGTNTVEKHISGSATSFDVSTASVFTTSANGGTISFTGEISGGDLVHSVTLIMTGSGTFSWSNISWSMGTAPELTNGTDIFTFFTVIGGGTWHGVIASLMSS